MPRSSPPTAYTPLLLLKCTDRDAHHPATAGSFFGASRWFDRRFGRERNPPKAGERRLDVMRWGLVPFWTKGIKVGFANTNAMAETVDTKPAFREAF
ncbi:MAG: SOS response-associated peptidase family protein, partial [Xanthobacteraceae bacterium]